MNKIIPILIIAIAAVVLISGCVQQGTSDKDSTTGTPKGAAGKTFTTTTSTDNGDVTTTVTTGTETGFCSAGASMTSTSVQGGTSMIVKGLTTFKGKQMCYATVEVSGAQNITFEYDFTEGQKDAWIVMKDSSGNIISETHSTG